MDQDGVLYVEIMPTTDGISKSINRSLGDAFQSSETKGKGFFKSLGGLAKGVFSTVAAGVGLIGGLAIKGGISRALNIEDASAKLKGLGHDVDAVKDIMNDALNSVRGTAFAMDSAATVAATAVAAGVKPGQELEKYLRLVADGATIAGVSMEEMGSIMNKMTTAGKVYTMELNQLADKGLPVWTWLQEEYGVTAEELRKMVSAGEIDADRFQKIMEEKIGGSALASGDTTRGAFANMGAALSRLGLVFVSGPLGNAKSFFQEMITFIDGVTERIKNLLGSTATEGEELNKFTGLADKLLGFIDRIPFDKIKNFFGSMGNLGPLLGGAAGALAPFLSKIPILGRILPTVTGPLGILVGLFAGMVASSPKLQTALGGTLTVLGEAFSKLMTAIEPIFPIVMELLTILGNALADVLIGVTPLITMLAETFIALIPSLMPVVEFLIQLVSAAAELIPPIMELLEAVLPRLIDIFNAVLPPILAVVGVILDNLTPVINGIKDVLKGVIDFITGIFTGDWKKAWDGIVTAFTGIFGAIGGIFTAIWNGVLRLIGEAVNLAIDVINNLIWLINQPGSFLKDIGLGGWEVPSIPYIKFDQGKGGGGGGAGVKYMAEGGIVGESGLAWVGEKGPELAWFPRNAQVFSNPASKALENLTGGDVINIYPEPNETTYKVLQEFRTRRAGAKVYG